MEPAQAAQPQGDDLQGQLQQVHPNLTHPASGNEDARPPIAAATNATAAAASDASSSDITSDSEDIFSEDPEFSSGFTSGEEEGNISMDEETESPVEVTMEDEDASAASAAVAQRRSVASDFVVDVLDLTQEYADDHKSKYVV